MFAGNCFRLVCALSLTLLCCNNGNAQQTVNLNHICALLPNGAMIADTTSCSNYYSCYAGNATAQSCGPSYYFSKDKQQCMPPSEVNCGSQGADVNPCGQLNIGTWAPVAGSCSGYYYCSATGPQRSNCPNGETFVASLQSCQYSSNYPCYDSEPNTNGALPASNDGGTIVTGSSINLCSYIQDGVYFGSAGSCAGWNICHNNYMTSGNCQSLDFNVQLGKCDYVADVNCAQVTNDPMLVGAIPTTNGACSQYGAVEPSPSCYDYYFCNGQTYQLEECSGGLFFDTITKKCMSRLNAYNINCDRCIGSKKSFVNMGSKTSCNGYLYCVNGIEQSSGYCAINSYFNEIAGACIQGTEPSFGCCNPSYQAGSSTVSPSAAPSSAAPSAASPSSAPNNGASSTPSDAASQSGTPTTTPTPSSSPSTLSPSTVAK